MKRLALDTALLVLLALVPSRSRGDDGMVVEGTLGNLPQNVVRSTIASRRDAMVACFTTRYEALPVLGGRVVTISRVGLDGSVRYVRVTSSDLGDRQTERCLASVLGALRYPRPTGGEAEVRDIFELPVPTGKRPPSAWTEARVRPSIARSFEALHRRCNLGGASVNVTVIIGPGGRALSAGISSEAELTDRAIDCVVSGTSGLGYADPGSYLAKVTLTL